MFLIKSFAVLGLIVAQNALAVSGHGDHAERPTEVQSKLSVVENSPEYLRLQSLLENHRRTSGQAKTGKIRELTVLTPTEADQLAHLFSKYMPGTAFDGLCFVRNYFWQLILEDLGVKSASAMLRKTVCKLRPKSESAQGETVERWLYHIAPTVCVGEGEKGCAQLAILDPAFSEQAITVSQWRELAQGETRFTRLQFFEPGVSNPRDIHEGKSSLSQDGIWSLRDHQGLGDYFEHMKFTHFNQ